MKRLFRQAQIPLMLVAAALLAAVPAMAWGGHHGRDCGPGHDNPGTHMSRMLHHLDLTAEQQDQVRGLLDEHHEAMEPQREQMRAAHESLRQQVHAETYDEAAVREAANAVAALQADQIVAHARLINEVQGLLTPAQIEELREMLERRPASDGERGHGMAPGGFGHGHGPGKRGHRNPHAE